MEWETILVKEFPMEPFEKVSCPCESGKRYVGCCLDRHFEASRRNLAGDFQIDLKRAIAGKTFASLDEANAFLRAYHERKNAEPKADFMGFSADQIHRLIDFPLKSENSFVRYKYDFPAEELDGIQVVTNARRFLTAFAEAGPLKATAAGNLPRTFAEQMFEAIDRSKLKEFIKFRSESDSMEVHSLRILLELAGWIRKTKGSFRLTEKGKKVNKDGLSPSFYGELLKGYTNRFNWAYHDRYPGFEIIQRAWLFSLYILRKKARGYVESHSISPFFIRAFPLVLAEVERPWKNIYSIVDDCYSLRFLERFCAYFGLIEVRERIDPLDRTLVFKVSPLFDRFISWRVT
jgi:hypothetical protein